MTSGMVTIRPFQEKDIPYKVRWINDNDNNQYLHYDLPLKEEETRMWFQKNQGRTDRYDAVIEYNRQPVGVIGLLEIKNRQAEYYVTLGEKDCKGKGIARKATLLLLENAFSVLRLQNIYLYTEIENTQAQRLFEACGFIRLGIAESSAINRGLKVDRYSYRITAADYFLTGQLCRMDYITPVYKISESLNQIYIKRDDLIPVSFGGNKARKAKLFFKEIDEGGYDCVVTYGSSSSNHCRIISNMAAMRNLPCYIIEPSEASRPTCNSKMMRVFGAKIKIVSVEDVHNTIENVMRDLKTAGKKPYFISGGGHGNLGTQAYVECYEEIRAYERNEGVFFDYIFFASGTGTTQAGLVCGQLMHGDDRRIVGISIARTNPRGRKIILDSITSYFQEKHISYTTHDIEEATIFEDGYAGNGYGMNSTKIKKIIYEMLWKYGIPMDSTYTAKAYSGMVSYLNQRNIIGKNILFLHTGGTPLFFDDLQEMIMLYE